MATALEQLKTRRDELDFLRSDFSRLHDYLIRLRCEDPPKGTRNQAFLYQSAQIEKLTARCVAFGGTEDGWPDPADDFAGGDQLKSLRQALEEVETGPYPLPLPPGCRLLPQANFDPFEHGRLYNGKLHNGMLNNGAQSSLEARGKEADV